ncbi:MAG: hypothetical protein L0Z62_34410 [Gemmataceae bacterium]|nr:hypothetical protein [Gemmataceae bacterium]
MQPCPGAFESPPGRAGRPAELAGRFLLSTSLQAAQDQRQAIPLRQPLQLLVQGGKQFANRHLFERVAGGGRNRLTLMMLAAQAGAARLETDVAGDTVQPAGQRRGPAYRRRLPGQQQERRLEGILGGGLITEDAATNAQHHRPVPAHQLGERLVVLSADIALQQDGIGRGIDRRRQSAEVAQERGPWSFIRGAFRDGDSLPL